MKHEMPLCGQNAERPYIKAGGNYVQWPLKKKYHSSKASTFTRVKTINMTKNDSNHMHTSISLKRENVSNTRCTAGLWICAHSGHNTLPSLSAAASQQFLAGLSEKFNLRYFMEEYRSDDSWSASKERGLFTYTLEPKCLRHFLHEEDHTYYRYHAWIICHL